MLKKVIDEIIENSGYISISNLIKLALYHPLYGYYTKKNPFGMGGDFVTSPQISSIFNEMFSLFFIYHFKKNYNGKGKIYFLELGAGNGFFIRDFLKIAIKIPALFSNLEIILVEVSEPLQAEQKKILEEFNSSVKIRWEKETLVALNSIFLKETDLLFIFSNEFFDAFPINQYIKRHGRWHEIGIVHNEAKKDYEFGLTDSDWTEVVKKHLSIISVEEESLHDNEIVEISSEAIEIFTEISRKLKESRGCAVTVDYGFLKTEFLSTLQSVQNHQQNDVLKNIGDADITYLVNFELLFYIAQNEGVNVFPPLTQKAFLESIGIREKVKRSLERELDPAKKYAIEASTHRIIGEDQMGELFKVLIFENYS